MDETYSTQDLYLAAALTLWFPLESLDRSDPGKCRFIFAWNDQLQVISETYWQQKLQVEPQAYSAAIRNVRNRIYNE